MATPTETTPAPLPPPLVKCFMDRVVLANVVDCDHYRIQGGFAIETDYIIHVRCTSIDNTTADDGTVGTTSSTKSGSSTSISSNISSSNNVIEPFYISKTYSSFRTFASQLKRVSDQKISSQRTRPSELVVKLCKYCDIVYNMVDSQRTRYFEKVNYMYVKALSEKRREILDAVLTSTCNYYPNSGSAISRRTVSNVSGLNSNSSSGSNNSSNVFNTNPDDIEFLNSISKIIETFFLTDHIELSFEGATHAPATTAGDAVAGTAKTTTTGATVNTVPTADTEHHDNSKHAVEIIKKPFVFLANTGTAGLNTITTRAQTVIKENAITKAFHHKDLSVDTNIANTNTTGSTSTSAATPTTINVKGSVFVVPLTTRSRMSAQTRSIEENELLKIDDANLVVQEVDSHNISAGTAITKRALPMAVPSYSHPKPTVNNSSARNPSFFIILLESNPIIFVGIMIVSTLFIKYAGTKQLTIDCDVAVLFIFASFCIGLHTPRPMIGGYDASASMKGIVVVRKSGTTASGAVDPSGRQLLRRSIQGSTIMHDNPAAIPPMSTILEDVDHQETYAVPPNVGGGADDIKLVGSTDTIGLGSPMSVFPMGAKIGSCKNCWSEPTPEDFQVRGPNYFTDKKKIASGEYLFPCRGLDLFLTDLCPENVGSNPGVFGGRLREVPTFLINFRLPWGVLVFYFEIPSRFVPFLRSAEEPDYPDKGKIPTLLGAMSPPDRCAAQFLMASTEQRNKVFKIIPVVIDGPWVVKSVVGGKPAIIGKKVPINYVYQRPIDKKELYLEADLDIAASSAARNILSLIRSYTQILTLNLGFVIEACTAEELPEQMLVAARLHGIDPLTAPTYPSCSTSFQDSEPLHGEEEEED